MNATAYLETLIRHVVSEMEFLPESPAARCARERVEAAAAALAAMGLLSSDDVTAFGERADAAMEASGLIRRISIEQSVSASVDAAGRRPADQRAEHARRRLEGVLPIAVESQLADDGRLVMLSVNRWNVGFDVMFALLDQAAGARDALRDEWQWTVHDDAGMRYECHTAGASGGGDILWLRAHGQPPIRSTASRLDLLLERNGIALLSATLDL